MSDKPNILILGASGGVAAALLPRLARERDAFGRLLLLDRSDGLLADPYLPHGELRYEFQQAEIDLRADPAGFAERLRRYAISILIDLSLHETRPILEAADRLGVSYLNTGVANARGESFFQVVLELHGPRTDGWSAPHILCAGMNPGIVNLWVRQAVERHGSPEAVVHFEYDTAEALDGWRPLITWSRETFLDEILNDPAGRMAGRDRFLALHPNPLKHRRSMRDVLRPVMQLERDPRGFLLLHEENVTIAQTYDVPSSFLLALDPRTMDYLETEYARHGTVAPEQLALGDNRRIRLKGENTIGIMLDYGARRFHRWNTTSQQGRGSSGSCRQVAAGVHAALFTLLEGSLQRRVYFPEDLYGTRFERLAEANLPSCTRWV